MEVQGQCEIGFLPTSLKSKKKVPKQGVFSSAPGGDGKCLFHRRISTWGMGEHDLHSIHFLPSYSEYGFDPNLSTTITTSEIETNCIPSLHGYVEPNCNLDWYNTRGGMDRTG